MGRYAVLSSESFNASSGQERKRMKVVAQDTKPWVEGRGFEDRRYPRFQIHLPIEYYRPKATFSHTGNISEGGLLIYFPEIMDVSQSLRLKLFFSLGSELNILKVLAEVVWMDNNLGKGQENYPIGVKFVHISPEDEGKLKNLLTNLSSPLKELNHKTLMPVMLMTFSMLSALKISSLWLNIEILINSQNI